MGCCFSRGLQAVRYLFVSAVAVLAGCGGGGGTTGGGVDPIPVATDSSAPLLSIVTSFDTAGQARGVVKEGNRVYVADGASGLVVLQLSPANRFSKIGSLALTTASGRAYALVKSGNYLFMAARSEGVHVINVSNPSSPTRVTTISTPGDASYLVLDQNRLFVSAGNSLVVVDVANPASPTTLGSITGTSANQHLLVESNTVYLAAYTGGLRIVDVSDPTAPVILSNTRASNNAGTYYNVSAIAKKDNYVYLGGGGSGVLVYDVSNLSSPKLVNQIALAGSTAAAAPYPPYSMAIWENFLFVADGEAGIRALDITMAFVPKLLYALDTPGSVLDLFIDGLRMVAADYTSGVQLIDIFETTDRDGDGVVDGADAFPNNPAEWADTDGDGIGNNADSDDDNDGIPDANDAFPTNPDEWLDTDGDGVGDNSDAFLLDPSEWTDSDLDGIGNNTDGDDDNDGIPDAADENPIDPFNIVAVTSDAKGHRHPKLENNTIVWRGYTSSGAPAIFVKDLITGEVENITQGISGFIGIPAISNGQVAWRVWNQVDRAYIYLWDGNQSRVITDYDPGNFTMPWGYPPSYYSVDISFENGKITWAGWDGADYEIYLWDGTNIQQITNNSIDDYEPQLSNNQISWTATLENGVFEVFFWDGTSIRNVSNRLDQPDEDSHLRNGVVVWSGWTNSTYRRDIYIWDGVNTVVINLPGDDYEPHIDDSGQFVTWSNRNNGQYDVFIWDGYEVVKLITEADFDENEPYANNGRIAFSQDTDVGADIYIAKYNVDKDGDGVVNGADAFPLDPSRQ